MNATWILILASFLISLVLGAELAQTEIPELIFFGGLWWESVARFYPSAHVFLSLAELVKNSKMSSNARLGGVF